MRPALQSGKAKTRAISQSSKLSPPEIRYFDVEFQSLCFAQVAVVVDGGMSDDDIKTRAMRTAMDPTYIIDGGRVWYRKESRLLSIKKVEIKPEKLTREKRR